MKYYLLFSSLIFSVFLAVVLSIPITANTATITVTENIDDNPAVDNGSCSLREAITSANTDSAVDSCTAGSGDDEIIFDSSLEGETIFLDRIGSGEDDNATGDLDVNSSDALTIGQRLIGIGGGDPPEPITIDGNNTDRIFDANSNLSLISLVLQNGGNVTRGGGILSHIGADLVLESILIQNNVAENTSGSASGGGIDANGSLMMTFSVVRDNMVTATPGNGFGGGINWSSDSLSIIFTSITGNVIETDDMGSSITGGGLNLDDAAGGDNPLISDTEISNNTLSAPNGVFASGAGLNLEPANSPGFLEIVNTTISGNNSGMENPHFGGGISNSGNIFINNTTITNNTAEQVGGLLVSGVSTTTISNSIVAGNEALSGPDCGFDLITSMGWNIIGNNSDCDFVSVPSDQVGDVDGGGTAIDPMLGTLSDNGGFSRSHQLLTGSPAIDMGDPVDPAGAGTCLESDQRSIADNRPFDGDGDGTAVCDIGAFELQSMETPPLSGSSDGGGCGSLTGRASTQNIAINFMILLLPLLMVTFRIIRRNK